MVVMIKNSILIIILLMNYSYQDISITSVDSSLNVYVNGAIVNGSTININSFTVQNINILLNPNDLIEVHIDTNILPTSLAPGGFIAEVTFVNEEGSNETILSNNDWYCGFVPSVVIKTGNIGFPEFGGVAIAGINSSSDWIWDYLNSKSIVCSLHIRPIQLVKIYMSLLSFFDAIELKDVFNNSKIRKELNDIARSDTSQSSRCREESLIVFVENGDYLYFEIGNDCSSGCGINYGFSGRITIERRNKSPVSIDLLTSNVECSDHYRSLFRPVYVNSDPVFVSATTGNQAGDVCTSNPYLITSGDIIWSDPFTDTIICRIQIVLSDLCS
jgi:hypothetical protein